MKMKTGVKIFLVNLLVNIHPQRQLIIIILILVITNRSFSQEWTLQQCIDTALVYNKNLQISANNQAIGEQKLKEAKSNLFPKINVAGEYKYFVELPYQIMPMSAFGGPEGQYKEIQFGVPHNINASLQAFIPLYNPLLTGGIRNAGIASEIAELQYKKTEEQIFFEISNLYFNAQILQHQLEFIEGNITNTSRLLENLKLLREKLMVKGTDVSKVELQQEQLITQRQLLMSNIEQVTNVLKFSMGLSNKENIEVATEIRYDRVNEYSRGVTIDEHLTDMHNLFLKSELKTLKSSYLPTLTAYGTYAETGFGYSEQPNEFLTFHPTSFVGLQLSFPLFNGTVTTRKINQKKLEIKNNELQKDLVTEQNNMLVENAQRQRKIAQENIANTLLQINLANRIYEQVLLQQKEGTAALTEVLMADNALREAQQNNLSAIVEYLKADLELKKLTGNILSHN